MESENLAQRTRKFDVGICINSGVMTKVSVVVDAAIVGFLECSLGM